MIDLARTDRARIMRRCRTATGWSKEQYKMQVLYRTELAWTAKALTEKADQLKRFSGMAATTDIERGSYLLRAEQLRSIAERLAAAVTNGDKRITIW